MPAGEQEFTDADYPQAVELARQAHDSLVAAYLRAQPSPAARRPGRCGTTPAPGAYPGDWDRIGQGAGRRRLQHGAAQHALGAAWPTTPATCCRGARRSQKHGDQIAAVRGRGQEARPRGPRVEGELQPVDTRRRSSSRQLRREGRTQVTVHGEPLDWLCPSHPENQRAGTGEHAGGRPEVRRWTACTSTTSAIPTASTATATAAGSGSRRDTGRKVEPTGRRTATRGPRRDEYNDWRCQQITRLVAAVHREAKKLRPAMKISAAVFGGLSELPRVGRPRTGPRGSRPGYLDFVCPMDYTDSDDRIRAPGVEPAEADRRAGSRSIRASGPPPRDRTLSADRVVGQIHHARQLGRRRLHDLQLSAATAETIVPAVGQSAGSRRPLRRTIKRPCAIRQHIPRHIR